MRRLRSIALFAALLLAGLCSSASARPSGRARRIRRPGMAVRRNFGRGFITRARTVGISRDGKRALVVAVDRHGQIWNVELDLATGRNASQLKHIAHYGQQEARFFSADHLDKNIPHELIRAHLGTPALTRSHKNLRVVLPGTELGVPEATVLVGTKKLFSGAGHWVSTRENVRIERVRRSKALSQRATR